ncbi:638_t:CDS:2 [Funneliformis geosporum]|uniref:2626_t:CDS:1 n=1 Tax=Funneliformis geosporum TaxID=1117311 RepID=A0A9W4T3H5_9GLOM|nr:2626_t:CDS:2 [Funneliformis geosporum]CAI2189439.1 638_t:CDS:2 [Funneliformis geosporum]
MSATAAARNSFMKNWFRAEIIPIYAVTGVAVVGASWYLTRLARGPEVIWDKKNNPTPWNNIEDGTQVKLIAVNQKFDRKYVLVV